MTKKYRAHFIDNYGQDHYPMFNTKKELDDFIRAMRNMKFPTDTV